jgi:hypothetical protein
MEKKAGQNPVLKNILWHRPPVCVFPTNSSCGTGFELRGGFGGKRQVVVVRAHSDNACHRPFFIRKVGKRWTTG